MCIVGLRARQGRLAAKVRGDPRGAGLLRASRATHQRIETTDRQPFASGNFHSRFGVSNPFSVVPVTKPLTQPRSVAMPRSKQRRRAAIVVLVSAFASFLLSVTLWFTGHHEQGLYVGLWVPSILSFGSVALLIDQDRHE